MNQTAKTKMLKTKEEYEDEENNIQIQKSLEEDMEEEPNEKAEAKAEMAWDAHKEECPEVEHEKCFS